MNSGLNSNGPYQPTPMDSYCEEHYLIDNIDYNADTDTKVPETDDIVILSDNYIMKLKVE